MPLLQRSVNGFWKRSSKKEANRLCVALFTQARSPIFYEKWGVPDTLPGRFDGACLHLALLLRYVKGPLAQEVFDAFFSYTELTLRETGVSDLRVGKQVKKCAKYFYGALKAYSDALDAQVGLQEALVRNLYGGECSAVPQGLEAYVKDCDEALKKFDFTQGVEFVWPRPLEEEVLP